MPFKAQTVASLKKLILEGEYLMPDFISRDCSRVIRGLLQHEPAKRLTIAEVKESSSLKGQPFPTSLPKYKVSSTSSQHPPVTGTPGPFNVHEEEVRSHLNELGITDYLLLMSREKGVRSNVMGTY